MARHGRTVEGPFRTRGPRGQVRVEEDRDGRQWVTCSGCRLDQYAPGVTPNAPVARAHAARCTG